MYVRVITRNITITIQVTTLVSILLSFHAVSLRLLLNLWDSNDPEPEVNSVLLELTPLYNPCHDSAWLWRWRANNKLGQNRVSGTYLKTCHLTACCTSLTTSISVSISILDVTKTSSRFAYISISANIYRCTLTFSTRIYRGKHKYAHMYDEYTREIATIKNRSLVGRGERKTFVWDKGLAHTKKQKGLRCQVTEISNLREIRAHRAPS